MVQSWKSGLPAGMEDWVRLAGGGAINSSGEIVNIKTAMQIAAFYACVRVISEDVAKIPLNFYKRSSDGTVEAVPTHPLYPIFNEYANGWQSGFDFREMQQAYLLLRGDAYSLKVRSLAAGVLSDGKGQIVEMVPILPDRVKVERMRDGMPKYIVQPPSNEAGSPREFTQDDIYHERGLSLNGYTGVSPIQYQAELLGFALAQTKYGGRMLGRGGKPGGVLTHPGKVSAPARERLREGWDTTFSGDGLGKTAVLEEGMTWQVMGMKNVDMQYLEVMKLNRGQIASIFRVPPHKIGDLEKATFSNIEQQAIEYVMDCLFGWCKRRETAIRSQLIDAPQFYYAEHNLDALLRGDLKSRYEAYAIARNWGWLCVNDIRRRENMNGIGTVGDIYLQPLNMVPAGTDVAKLQQPSSDAVKKHLEQIATELGRLPELLKILNQ